MNFQNNFSEIKALNREWLKRQITLLCRVADLRPLICGKKFDVLGKTLYEFA